MKRKALVVLLLGLGLGCSDGPGAPGELGVFLVSPNQIEGAAIIEIDAIIEQVQPAPTGAVFAQVVDGRTRIAVLMRGPGQVWFRAFFPDARTPPVARVLEVADGRNAIRPTLDGYHVRFERVSE